MPVNKGLLLSAAMANGLNAFLDAREKGDLQRQRQAVSQISEQIKAAQLQNLYGVGRQQDIDYQLSVGQYPHQLRGSKSDADYKASRATEMGVRAEVAGATKASRISQQEYKTDEQEQIALRAAIERQIEEFKLALQKFDTSVRTLGYADANAMIEDYDDPKTPEFKKASMRKSLGITTDAQLRELVDTVANRLGEADISVKDAQEAYLKAGAAARTKQAAWYEIRAKNADILTPTDAEILIGAGVDSADIPKKYSQLDYSQMKTLREADDGPFKFDQVTLEGGKLGIIRYNLSDGTVEVVPITKSDQYLLEQFKNEEGDQEDDLGLPPPPGMFKGQAGEGSLDASVSDGSGTVELAPDTDDGNALAVMIREGIERRAFEANHIIRRYREVNAHFKIITSAYNESLRSDNMTFIDQALINLFNKIIDPDSAVRMQEYARTPHDQALVRRWKGQWDKLFKGGAGLVPEDRQSLLRMAGLYREAYVADYNEQRDVYVKSFDSYREKGLDVTIENVAPSIKEKGWDQNAFMNKGGRKAQIGSDAKAKFGAP